MADIEITCPECGNKRGVPDELVGKKIKCKKCQHIFTVKAPAAAKPAQAAEKLTGAKPTPVKKKEEEGDQTPYVMREENLTARCPHCALPLEPPDAKICIHCGYHMQHRRRVESKQTFEITAGDYIMWHLPTVGCFVAIGMLIGFNVFCIINMGDWHKDSVFDGIVPGGCFSTWIVILSCIPGWLCARFIFRRLVWYFTPPEKIKRGGEATEDEEFEDEDYEDEDDE